MPATPPDRKRAVNLTLSESLVERARDHTDNLSATVEGLLDTFVADRQRAQEARRKAADACAAGWNEVHDRIGSFADDHSTL